MGVGVPGHFSLALAQPARNFLNVNAVVSQQGDVAVPYRKKENDERTI